MPAFTSIAIEDRATTPVTHTFTPRDPNYNGAQIGLFATETGVPMSEAKLTISTRRTGTKRKCKLTLSNPAMVVETINGVDRNKIERIAYASLDLTFDESSTLQERKDLVGMLANALAADVAPVDGVLTKLEGYWG